MELLIAERGVVVTYESVRAWCEKFGRQYAQKIRRQRGPMGDAWHLDEVYLKINGVCQNLWRAVDQEGQVIDILVQPDVNASNSARQLRERLHDSIPHFLGADFFASGLVDVPSSQAFSQNTLN